MFAAKSDKNWAEGNQCVLNGNADAAANRLYYAVFQAVKSYAILINQMDPDKPGTGSAHTTALEIVGQGPMGQTYRRHFNRLKGYRESADYSPVNVRMEDLKGVMGEADCIRKHFLKKSTVTGL